MAVPQEPHLEPPEVPPADPPVVEETVIKTTIFVTKLTTDGTDCLLCKEHIEKGANCAYGFLLGEDDEVELCFKHPYHPACAAFLKSLINDNECPFHPCLCQA